MTIYFHAEEITYQLKGKRKIRNWFRRVIEEEGNKTGEINIIFTSDPYLLKINNQYLKRDYFTDIITFDFSDGNSISGDLYISIDRIRENARINKTLIRDELLRIIIHGILHLLGYDDSKTEERVIMSGKENKYLGILKDYN